MMLQLSRPIALTSLRVSLPLPAFHACVKWLSCASIVAALTGCQSAIGRTDLQEPQLYLSAVESYVGNQGNLSVAPSSTRQTLPINDANSNSWLKTIDTLYAHARTLVEKELSVDLLHIKLLVSEDQPINDEVTRETIRLITSQFGKTQFSERFLSKVMDAQVGTYAALFSSRLNAVMVSRKMLRNYEDSLPQDSELRKAALLTLLIHELVHAADDLRYHIHDNRALNFRASFAQSATFEGHAQWVTRNICILNNCLSGLNALDNFMFNRNAAPAILSQPVEAISHNVLEYSYVEGERFIATLAKRENGDQLIDRLLSSPPEDPIQILAPASFPDVERENRNQRLIRAGLDIDHPWVQGNWIGVETSPLKGVNLRSDPAARSAAIDGFTRLINSMVSLQLYDQSMPESSPIEVTVLQTETTHTASLFARTLHENAAGPESSMHDESVTVKPKASSTHNEMKAHLYRTALPGNKSYKTTIAVSGDYLVQISGQSISSVVLDDYAVRVLLNLKLGKINL
ncbi:MAG: hypothetical protein ACI9UN_001676 [Granulosicoccus sp.]|jgi:hypothetical protein